MPCGLKNIILGDYFNKKIKLPEELESVKFGRYFNQEIKLPCGLKSVKFGDYFNQEIILPEGLKSIKFGRNFNRKIKLPEGLKSVAFYYNFKLNLLPNNLEEICIDFYKVNKNINYFTNKIKKCAFTNTMKKLKNLPNTIKFIVSIYKKEHSVLNKYSSRIKISKKYGN